MGKSLGLKLFAVLFLGALVLSFMPDVVEAGLPRFGGFIYRKYKTKVITGISVGRWSPWRWISADLICPNGLWSFDYIRWRPLTKIYWTVERWLAWGWLDNNIVIFETPRIWSGPFSYTIWQRQIKQVYWFNPFEWDVRFTWAELQIFPHDSLLWADWTGIDLIVDPATGRRVIAHRTFFDDELLYEGGHPGAQGTDAMSINLADYELGQHLIRIDVMWDDGTIQEGFMNIPIQTEIVSMELTGGPIGPRALASPQVLNVTPGTSETFPITVTNHLNETRAVYFRISDYDPLRWDIDVIDNGTLIDPLSSRSFDVFVYTQPHTPVGDTIEVEIVAMSLEGLNSFFNVSYTAPGHSSSMTFQARAVAGSPAITLEPSGPGAPTVALVPSNVTVKGSGFTPNAEVNVTLSSTASVVATANTDPSGNFTAYVYLPFNFKPYGVHAIAAIDGNGTAAVANLTVGGPDINDDGKVDIKDIAYVAKNFGQILSSLTIPLSVGTMAIVVPAGILWLRRNKKRKLEALNK